MAPRGSDTFRDLVGPNPKIEQLATGFQFVEGPIWNPAGQYLLFSDIGASSRFRWDQADGVRKIAEATNEANGMTLDANACLLVCEHTSSAVARMSADGTGSDRVVLAARYDGKALNSPNDIVVHSSGTIYFTDPTFGRWSALTGETREAELDFRGVYRMSPDGGQLSLLIGDFAQPNGLCFSPDESLLYINDSDRAHVRVFDVAGDGTISNGRMFAEGVGTGDEAGGLVDGMKCDEHGNVWVTGPDGLWLFMPSGEKIGVIEIPETVGNFHWGGPDWDCLFVTATTSLYRLQTRTRGRREPFLAHGR
jgi:gluconolactonase